MTLPTTPAPRARFLVLTLVAGCAMPVPMNGGSDTQEVQGFPCDASVTDLRSERGTRALTGAPFQPHEAHDCQKLQLDEDRFGPLVGIYPIESAGGLDEPGDFSQARVVASVFNWSSSGYQPLSIEPQWNCLWLRHVDGDWRATIVPPRDVETCVAEQPMATLPAGPSFEVETMAPNGNHPVPRTARWGLESNEVRHYMGVKCADAWCSIGVGPLAVRPVPPGVPGSRHLPGWYDEQHLAVFDSGQKRLRPGPWGVIIPVPGHENLSANQFATRRRVAMVRLNGTPRKVDAYRRAFNFEPTPARGPQGVNQIFITRRDTGWVMTVQGGGNPQDTAEYGIARLEQAHQYGGAVRWRWDAEDDKSWIACGDACCTSQNARAVM